MFSILTLVLPSRHDLVITLTEWAFCFALNAVAILSWSISMSAWSRAAPICTQGRADTTHRAHLVDMPILISVISKPHGLLTWSIRTRFGDSSPVFPRGEHVKTSLARRLTCYHRHVVKSSLRSHVIILFFLYCGCCCCPTTAAVAVAMSVGKESRIGFEPREGRYL